MGTFAIGDIHGEADALQTLMDLQLFQQQDAIIFLGDYVNNGPKVRDTIEQLIRISTTYKTIFLTGNHEITMLRSRNNPRLFANWMFSGGKETLASYGTGDEPNWQEKVPETHWNFLESCQPYFEMGNIIFVHAGLESGVPLAEQHPLYLYWKPYLEPSPYSHDKMVICGHTARSDGRIADFGHTICIDTHACGGQWLTCLEVEKRNYWQVRGSGEVRTGSLDQ